MIRQNFFENLSKVFRGKHFEIGIFLYVRTKHGGDGNFLEHFFAVLLFFLFGLFGDNEKFVFVQSDRYILIRAKTRIKNDCKTNFIKELEAQIETLKAAPKPQAEPARVEIKDDAIVRFKVKFNDFQNLLDNMSDLIEDMETEQAGKCKNAVKIVFEDSIFGETK